jgi:D-alanyl-D-alanine carboxypeptidase (penicillin-binding protein 5/6)
MRLISLVLGAPSEDRRAADSRALLSWGFRFFETHRLYAADETLEEARIWKGSREMIELGLASDLHVTIPRGEYDNLRAEMSLPKRLEAPLQEGCEVGTVEVMLDEETVTETVTFTDETAARSVLVGEGTTVRVTTPCGRPTPPARGGRPARPR